MALIDNVQNYWKLDEASGTRADEVGGKTLTDNATVGSAAGVIGNCAVFDGSTEFLSQTINPILQHSINAWVYINVNNAYQEIVGIKRYISGSDWSAQEFRVTNVGKLQYTEGIQASGESHVITGVTTINTTGWHMVTVTCTGDTTSPTFILYLDGNVDKDILATNNGIRATWTTDAGGFGIGCLPAFFGSNGFFLNGNIDEVGIWTRVLSAAEITSLYNSGAGFAYPFTAAGPANLKTWDGLAKASIKTFNNLAIASVKTWDGLA